MALALAVTLAVIAFAAWLPNLHLLTGAMFSSSLSFGQKTRLLTGLLGSLRTNFTFTSLAITFTTAALAGTQTSLMAYYLRQTADFQRSMGASAIGVLSSMLGIGCASCGSVILVTLIGLSSTSVVLGMLPFKGQEFGFIGIAILIYSLNVTIKKINQPMICKIKGPNEH